MKQEEGKDTLEDYLLERVKKSGYPLEIEISDALEREKFVVFNTQYFFDEERKKGRDIDIYALPLEFSRRDDKLLPLIIRTDVAIECKKSETHAWVFYTRPRISLNSVYISGQYRDTIPQPKTFSPDTFKWLLQNQCLVLHYGKFERIAIAYEEIKKKKKDKDTKEEGKKSRREIFEAINQLVKFSCYEIHRWHDRTTKLSRSTNWEYIVVLFPIIVFDGDMFETFLVSGEPILERRNHMSLVTHYRCPYCGEVESFTVDIVHRSYFNEFIQAMKMHFYKTRQIMLENREELLEKAKRDRMRFEKEKAGK